MILEDAAQLALSVSNGAPKYLGIFPVIPGCAVGDAKLFWSEGGSHDVTVQRGEDPKLRLCEKPVERWLRVREGQG